jgi:hypothetical protein
VGAGGRDGNDEKLGKLEIDQKDDRASKKRANNSKL